MQGRQFQGSSCPETVASIHSSASQHVTALLPHRGAQGGDRHRQQTVHCRPRLVASMASSGHAHRAQRTRGRSVPHGQRQALVGPRQRVAFADARRVRVRVETDAAAMALRGSRRHVLTAVLALLCGWSRTSDDAMRLSQIVDAAATACGRRYNLKTVGRALSRLAELGLITYVPACGRGARGLVAIPARFLDGVEPLGRDSHGSVITKTVTFCGPHTSYRPNPYLPTLLPPAADGHRCRPRAVKVEPHDVRNALAQLPPVFAQLPRHLRWRLGREIRDRLAAGFEVRQILAVLQAPVPADLQRPWRLALWRLRHNMPGSGPRLARLQRAWDQRQAAEERAAHAADTERWHQAVIRAVGDVGPVLAGVAAKFGTHIDNEAMAVAHAGRMAVRDYPGIDLGSALKRWLRALAPAAGPLPSEASGQISCESLGGGHGEMCVACQTAIGTIRPQLPLRSAVCDECWSSLAPTELQTEECS